MQHGIIANVRPYSPRALLSRKIGGSIYNFELGQSLRRPLQTILLLTLMYRARRLNQRAATIIHCFYTRSDLRDRLPQVVAVAVWHYQLAILRLLAWGSALVALDTTVQRRLFESGFAAQTIPIGVYDVVADPKRIERFRQLWNVQKTDVILGLVGHPTPFKRFAEFASLFAQINQCHDGARLRLIFVGGDARRDPDEWAMISRAIEPLGTEVIISGELDGVDFIAAIAALDVTVLPYEELAQGSGVLASILAVNTPALVSESTLFDQLVAAGGAVRYRRPSSCQADDFASLVRSLDLDLMRKRMRTYASSHSIARSATAFADLLCLKHL